VPACKSHSHPFSPFSFIIIMSVRHSNHSQPQSLPPFAVAFSNSSLDKLSAHPASLPPIQPRPLSERPRSLPDPSQSATMLESTPIPNGRKRSHPDAPQRDDSPLDIRSVVFLSLLSLDLLLIPQRAIDLAMVPLPIRVVSRRSTMSPPTTRIANLDPILRHDMTPILDLCPLLHRHPSLNPPQRSVA
jgi:hypothetical protein